MIRSPAREQPMSDLLFDTMKRLTPALAAGDLAKCERGVLTRLRALPRSPFHIAANLNISNRPEDGAALFDRYLARESEQYEVYAAYTEMNGFDINPDRWHCELFAYEKSSSQADDWQTKRPSDRSVSFTIKGLEQLQRVYASDAFQNEAFEAAIDLAGLLVVVKFQRFIKQVASHMTQLHFPILCTAHEYDFIAAITPMQLQKRRVRKAAK